MTAPWAPAEWPVAWWPTAALGVGLATAIGWGWWAHRRARALDRMLEHLRAVVDELAEGHLWARAFRESGSTVAAERLASSLNALARRLQDAQIRRHRQDEAYRRLVADLSHDLRTPLTSIIGYVEALRTGAGHDPARYLEIVAARSVALVRLVDDLLFLTRLEAGDQVTRPEPSDLSELVRRACEPFQDQFAAKAIRFALDLPPGPAPAVVDRTAVARILANLLQNALHHAGPVRHVCVRLARAATVPAGEPPGAGAWVLEVANDGDPIPADELPYVFERGFRGEQSRGSGLGLAIVRMLAEAHGGRAEVESGPEERRTLFRVHLPAP
ncbi:MAG: HAMP domain-containing histidine kinase [Limnochordaceae bacterium]|nr:HAMP domain-containing histidine kinase [Limnochordaceae bacterium]